MENNQKKLPDLLNQIKRTLDVIDISLPIASIKSRLIDQPNLAWFENYETTLTGFGVKLEHISGVDSKKLPKKENLFVLSSENECLIVDKRTDLKDGDVLDLITGQKTKLSSLQENFNFNSKEKFFKIVVPDEISKGSMVERIKAHWFWGVIWRNRSSYTQAGLASVLINIFAIATAMFTMIVYNKIIPANAVDSLVVLVFGVVVVLLVDFATRSIRSSVLHSSGVDSDKLIADRIFEQVIDMKFNTKKTSVGSLANTMREFEQVREFFTSATLMTLFDLPFAFFFMFVIWYVGGAMVIPVVIGCGALIAIALISNALIRKASDQNFEQGQKKHSVLVETISGIESIKSIGAGAEMRKRWLEAVSNQNDVSEAVKSKTNFSLNFSQVLTQAMQVCVVTVGVFLVRDGSYGYGAIIACTILLGKVVAPVTQFSNILSRVNQLITGFNALNDMMAQPREHPAEKSYVSRKTFDGRILLRNIKFSYPESENEIIKGVSTQIRKGQKVAIVGPNGSGKTTMTRLILGLYELDMGAIYIDGIDLRQIDPAEIRQHVGVVSQEPWLVSGTVKENILLSNNDVDEEQLIWAARASGVSNFVDQHPEGFNMNVGERGSALSGGQRQSVAIARAIIKKPKILLLDEPTSAVDPPTEKKILHMLIQELKESTMIIVTHRPAVLEFVDRILVFEHGKLVRDVPPPKKQNNPNKKPTSFTPINNPTRKNIA